MYALGHPLSDADIQRAFSSIDTSNDGSITYDEFRRWWAQKDRLSAFDMKDDNAGDGSMERSEVRARDGSEGGSGAGERKTRNGGDVGPSARRALAGGSRTVVVETERTALWLNAPLSPSPVDEAHDRPLCVL